MLRYTRLYLHFVRFSFSRALEFRFDFCFRIGMDMLWYAVNLSFFWVLYQHTASLGGWNYDQVLVFMGGVFVADALSMTVIANNMWMLPILVNKGDLDYYLVRPVSSLYFLSLRDFAANSFINLLMAGGLLGWALGRYPAALGAGAIVGYLALLLLGVFLHYTIQMMFLIPVFWLQTAGGLRDVFFALDQTVSRPEGIFRGWVRRVLVSVLPFALVISFPTRGLLEGMSFGLVAHMVGVTALAFVVMVAFWRRALRAYASASS